MTATGALKMTDDYTNVESAFDKLTVDDLKKQLKKVYICSKTGVYVRSFYENLVGDKDNLFLKLFIDGNGVKHINDTYGHAAGDLYIKKIADVTNRFTRPDDMLVRWGGDEFVLFVKTNDIAIAEAVKERIEMAFAHEKVSAAIGIGHTVEEADKKMYADKYTKKSFIYKLKQKFNRKVVFHIKKTTTL